MTYRLRNILVAVVLAVLAALSTALYVSNYKKSVQHDEGAIQVLVARQDIPAGTPGAEVVKRRLLAPATVTRRDVVPGAIERPAQLGSLIATQPTYAGEQVTVRRFGPVAETGVRGELTGSQRAFQVAGDANQLLAGTLRAGDRVDVVASLRFPEQGSQHYSRVVLRDLLVLKAPSGDGGKLASSSQPFSALLRVTTAQAEKLFFAVKNGDWSLQLRPGRNATDRQDGVESALTLLTGGLGPGEKTQVTGSQQKGSGR